MPQGTVTFLFTDIEGSTDLARRLGADFGSLRAEHRRVLREAFSAHDGHEIDTAGDGFFVVFERAGDAVGAAMAAQRAVAGLQEPLRVRMGLHTAEPHLSEDGYVGVGVHRAARVCAAGHGGQILLSARPRESSRISISRASACATSASTGSRIWFGRSECSSWTSKGSLGLPAVDDAERRECPRHAAQGRSLGWTTLLRVLGDEAALAAASRYHAIIDRAAERHGGRALELVADHALAFFERPRDAVRAALAAGRRSGTTRGSPTSTVAP